MKKFAAAFAVLILVLFAVPLTAASKEPICSTVQAAWIATATTAGPDGEPTIAQLYAHSMFATNDNARIGDCSARRVMDDDLFVPMLANALYGEDVRPFMLKFRRDVVRFAKVGQITSDAADKLADMAWKIEVAYLDRLTAAHSAK